MLWCDTRAAIRRAAAAASKRKEREPMSERQELVGSWRMTVFEEGGPPTQMLGTFGADGTVVTAEHPVVTPPGAPGVIFTSAGHGAWKTTGPETAIFRTVGLGSDGQGGLFAIVDFRAEVVHDVDERTFGGRFVATIASPDGEMIATFPGTVRAERLVAESPEQPRASA
jgi:hypothetical protein